MTVALADRRLAALVDAGLAPLRAPPVRGVRRRRSAYSTSAPVDDVDVELADGSRLQLVAKRVGRPALLGDAAAAKPDFVYDPAREAVAYELLSGEPGLPRFWGALDEPGGALLVLERVPGLALRHVGDLDAWAEAARWLAAFHSRWTEPLALPPGARRHLLRYDDAHHRELLERAARFATRAGAPLAPALVAGHREALDVLSGLATTLVHGEFYASNVLVRPSREGARVAPIDWETAGLGCPLLDLAALTSGDWEPWERRRMVDAYREHALVGVGRPDFERALCASRLLVGVQWMGWADGWEPPVDLLHDWTEHAHAMAAALLAPRRARPAPPARRAVVVNADDLGLSDGVNRGIFEAHDRGIVTSASLLVRAPAAGDAARGAAARPALAVGLHLDLGEWRCEEGVWRAVYEVVDVDDPGAVGAEVERQLAAFAELMGRPPTHLDSHQHVHTRPVVGAALQGLADRLGVPWRGGGSIRYRGDFHGQCATGEPLPEAITTENLIGILEALPPGFTELACHPGYPEGLDSAYGPERLVELRVLCHPDVRVALAECGVELVAFPEAAVV